MSTALIFRAISVLALGLVATLSLINPPRALLEAADDFWLHGFAYAVLALLVAQGWPQHRRGLWLFLILFGLGVEVLQDQTGYRSFQLTDLAANAAGIAIGACLTLMGVAVSRSRLPR